MSATIPRRARYLTVGGLAALGLAAMVQFAAQPVGTAAETYTVPLAQQNQLPIKNSSFEDSEDDCPRSPELWGWHFILPGNDASFVKLTTTFASAGTIVTTTFGPPSDKHAFVYTPTDDSLTAVSAEVTGGDPAKVRVVLSHTCDGGGVQPTESPSPTQSPTPSESVSPTETSTPTPSESVSPTETSTPTPTESVSPTETPTVNPTETGSPTETPTVNPTETGSPTETPTVNPTETGSPTETPTVNPTETGSPTETPTVNPTETGSPTETPTVAPTDTGSPTVAPTDLTGTPSPTVSGTQLTQTPSGSVSVSPTVRGVRQTRGPDVGGNTGALPTTGNTVPVGLLVLLGFALVAAGVVTTVSSEPQPVTAGGKHKHRQ